MSFRGPFIGDAFKLQRAGLELRGSVVMMCFAGVDQLTVLGATRVLNEQHVAAARALESQHEQPSQGASTPNH